MQKLEVPPHVNAFLVCREIFQDKLTGEYILVGPTNGFTAPEFPCATRVAIYGDLSEVRGEYFPALRLLDPDGDPIWSDRAPRALNDVGPLGHHHFVFHGSMLPLPRPGRYDLLLMAGATEIARQGLEVSQTGVAGR
ncbi:MAG TPA: hypothetical protein VFF52_05320 [Isosphaeraceae bacterium]|nr:hypothetical protein [Isosphaeraceae bacterium]